ncbi:MAG: transcriptional repressor, CopY family [Caulobacteraceae bacterium]|nr:transcriptional repressor, CopY family [Caulobacteraceae bacterium]
MPNPAEKISLAEAQVMEVLWRDAPLAAHQILAALLPHPDWTDGTVRTLIQRLVKKGAVIAGGAEKPYAYRPAVTREAYVAAESRGVMDRLFGGSLEAMMLHFARREEMSAERLAQLKAIVEAYENDL